ncbi:hypothetical protein FS837_000419 [Tulasnella sp. UAMH 9824]|nr:hypothetical protein FS837_000419 [Tulasnella sp. UAMH 9824]
MPGQSPGALNPWLQTCAEAMVALEHDLRAAEDYAKGQENTEIVELKPIQTAQTGLPGRPRKVINPIYLKRALSNRQMVSIAELARILGVCRSTIYRYMKLYNIDRRWSNITDGQLDVLLHAYRLHRPESGLQYFDDWNNHPISGPQGRNKSPMDMRLIGQTTEGFYLRDELEGVHEDLIQQYYGVEGMPTAHSTGGTGAGFNPEEDALGEDVEFDYDSTDEGQPASLKCKRVKPKTRAQCPFESAEAKLAFNQALDNVLEHGELPSDVGDGWIWDESAQLSIGRHHLAHSVRLPAAVWQDRAVVWAKALRFMVHLTERLDGMEID